MKSNNRAEIRNFLISLAILVAVMIILGKHAYQVLSIEDRPLGTAQTSVLTAAQEANKVLLFVDQSADLAAASTKRTLDEAGWQESDYEGGGFPCGDFIGVPYWNSLSKTCFPGFEDNLLSTFEGFLVNHLRKHPSFPIPLSYLLTAHPTDDKKTLVRGVAEEELSLKFYGGSKAGYTTDDQELFTPDYSAAKVIGKLNYGIRGGHDIEDIVVHYTVTKTLQAAVDALASKKYSYHYIIDKQGTVYQFVPEDKSAQHAGCKQTCPTGRSNCEEECPMPGMNQKSIGISFVNCGFDNDCQKTANPVCEKGLVDDGGHDCWEPYTQEQLDAFVDLVADIVNRNPSLQKDGRLDPSRILMHSDISKKKSDPGPAFSEKEDELYIKIDERLSELESTRQPAIPVTGAVVRNIILPTGMATAPPVSALARIQEFEDLIDKYSEKNQLDPAIVKALIMHESQADPNAESDANAIGLMQIVPFSTSGKKVNHDFCVKECGFKEADTIDELDKSEYKDPEKNICCGTALFKQLTKKKPRNWDCCGVKVDKGVCVHTRYENPYEIALRAYNGGSCSNWVDPDYVETVIPLYEYFGGSPLQVVMPKDSVFPGTYKMPISFRSIVDVDLDSMKKIEEFAIKAVSVCADDSEECFTKLLDDYNKTYKQNALTTKCDVGEKEIVKEFLNGYLGCTALPEGSYCNFTFPFYDYDLWDFKVYLSDLGVTLTSMNKFFYKPKIDGDVGFYKKDEFSKTESGQVILSFNPNEKSLMVTTPTLDKPKEFYDKDNELVLYFKKENGALVYVADPPTNSQRPPAMTKTLCSPDDELRFAILLRDRVPPPVFDIVGRYNKEGKYYELQWKPATYYDDNTNVTDVVEYSVYCSEQPFDLYKNDYLPEEMKTISIKHEDGKFSFDTYKNIEAINTILTKCGEADLSEDKEYYVTVTATDKLGQYNTMSYESVKINTSIVGELPYSLQYVEQNNQVYLPKEAKPGFIGANAPVGPVADEPPKDFINTEP